MSTSHDPVRLTLVFNDFDYCYALDNQEVVLLRCHSKKSILENFSSSEEALNLPNKERLGLMYQECMIIFGGVRSSLYSELDRLHNTALGFGAWAMMLDHWLWRAIKLIYERRAALKRVIVRDRSYSYINLNVNAEILTPVDTLSFTVLARQSCFDYIVLREIALREYQNISKGLELDIQYPLPFLALRNRNASRRPRVQYTNFLRRLINKTFGIIESILKINQIFIGDISFGRKERLLLYFYCRCLPRFVVESVAYPPKTCDIAIRTRLERALESFTPNGSAYAHLISRFIPVCYLEGFADLRSESKRIYPQKPRRVLFTDNAFDYNEPYKYFSAVQRGRGANIITMQHGGEYGTWRHNKPSPEEQLSDGFVTWGWSYGLNYIPFGITSRVCEDLKENRSINWGRLNGGGIIPFIIPPEPEAVEPFDTFSYHLARCARIVSVLSFLPTELRERVVLRLPPDYLDRRFDEGAFFKRFASNVRQDHTTPVADLFEQAAFCVQAADSTSLLEGLAIGVPTLMYFRTDHITDMALDFYRKFEALSVLTDDAAKLGKEMLAYHSGNLTQRKMAEINLVVSTFTQFYAKVVPNRSKELSKLLASIGSSDPRNP
jgi:putative transferase (TIGR04331 family)